MQNVFTVSTTFFNAGHTLLFIKLSAFKLHDTHLLVVIIARDRSDADGRAPHSFDFCTNARRPASSYALQAWRRLNFARRICLP